MMMPDLGKHSETVLSSYVLTILLLLVLVAITLWRGRRVRREMEEVETRMRRNG